ncbi:unnamed protein product [Sphagnum jensenii]|uniref:Uncharacterized protein n=1 Tax=Sphagnum jensenii TaxID=128206 RepID=A0ABP0XFM8_9BRYO
MALKIGLTENTFVSSKPGWFFLPSYSLLFSSSSSSSFLSLCVFPSHTLFKPLRLKSFSSSAGSGKRTRVCVRVRSRYVAEDTGGGNEEEEDDDDPWRGAKWERQDTGSSEGGFGSSSRRDDDGEFEEYAPGSIARRTSVDRYDRSRFSGRVTRTDDEDVGFNRSRFSGGVVGRNDDEGGEPDASSMQNREALWWREDNGGGDGEFGLGSEKGELGRSRRFLPNSDNRPEARVPWGPSLRGSTTSSSGQESNPASRYVSRSIGSRSVPSRPSIPGKFSKYSERNKKPKKTKNRHVIPSRPVPGPMPDFDYQFSYSENPKIEPIGFREPQFSPFGPSTMPRPWTGKAPLPGSKKKLPEFDSFKPPPPNKKGVKHVQPPGPYPEGEGPQEAKSREEILGEPLTKEEIIDAIERVNKENRQLNLGRDGLTHNMLDLIHQHWKRRRVCKIKCKGVPTVDMDNVCNKLEEKTGGVIIHRAGGVVYLFRGRNYNYKNRPHIRLMLWKPPAPIYPKLVVPAPGGLTKEEADKLRLLGRKLPAIRKLAKNGVYLTLVKEVKEAFEVDELVKVDCQGLNPSDYKKIGAKLKDLVPCVLLSFERESILMWRGPENQLLFKEAREPELDEVRVVSGNNSVVENGILEEAARDSGLDEVDLLWGQAVDSGDAVILDDTELDPDTVFEKVKVLAQSSEKASEGDRVAPATDPSRNGLKKEKPKKGGIQVTVSRGGGREVTLKGGGDGGSNCGSQSGTPRGRKENRGDQESLNWRGTSKSSSRRGRSNSKDRDDVSSLASNEDRPSFAAEMRREASSSSGGSRDGRSRGIGYGQRGNEKQFPGRAGEERGVGYGRGNWEGRWSDWSPRGSSYGSPRTPEVFKDQGRDGTIGRGERDFGDRRWRRGGMHNAYQGVGRQSDAYQNAGKYSVRSTSEAATPSGSWKEDALQTAVDEDVSLAIIGTCSDMCPAREREQRERLRDLAVFERVNGNTSKTSAELAVKKFCRTFSSTSLHPSDVRPLPVLWRTQHYLLCMLDRRDYSFETVHAFLFDRTRAIRQELGMQSILNSQAICMLEEIVRFHIMSERELRERTAGAGREVDLHLNLQQLSKALLTLLTMYSTEYSINGRRCPTEAEFHCYYVLLNLGDHDHFKAEPLSLWFRGVHQSVLKSSVMHFARTVLRCYRNENYRGFFESVRKATYLQACLMELFFSQMRGIALKLLNQGGYKLHPYPMADIAKMLLMKETDADELCKSYGLETGIDKSTKALSLLAKQAQFTPPEKDVFRHQCSLINSKRAASYYQQVTETEVDQ